MNGVADHGGLTRRARWHSARREGVIGRWRPSRYDAAMRFRFSLRWLLALFAVAAVLLWRHDRPTRVAQQLARALEGGDVERAKSLYVGEAEFDAPQEWRQHLLHRTEVNVVSPSLTDWLRGRRELVVSYFGVYAPRAHRREKLTVTTSGVVDVDVEATSRFSGGRDTGELILPPSLELAD